MAKILIVEDDKLLQEVYHDTLEAGGHQIETADDGEQGLEKIKLGGWDLILLDIIMPKLNGLDVIQKLTETPPATPNKCVVFLTNLDKGDEINRALQLGNGYIIKSQITPGDLVEKVNWYLNQPQGQSSQLPNQQPNLQTQVQHPAVSSTPPLAQSPAPEQPAAAPNQKTQPS